MTIGRSWRMALAVILIGGAVSARAQQSLTFNDLDDFSPVFCGKNIAWLQRDGGVDQVMLYDGKTTRALTSDISLKPVLVAGGKWLVWIATAGGYYDVMLWDGKTIRLLNRTLETQSAPHTDGKWVTWVHDSGDDSSIMLWDGREARTVLANVTEDAGPRVSNGRVVWYGPTTGSVYLFDGKQYVPGVSSGVSLVDGRPGFTQRNPDIEGKMIVWLARFDSVWHVYLDDGGEISQLSVAACSAATVPRLSRKCVVWAGPGNDGKQDIFLWQKGTLSQVTDTPEDEINPVHFGPQIAWVVSDGNDFEIMYYNGKGLFAQLSNNATIDHGQQINGRSVVWMNNDGVDMEINVYPGKLKLP